MIAPDSSAALRLMDGLHTPGSLLRLVGAHDAIGAKLIEAAGFDGIWASSLEIATCCGHVDDDDSNFTDVLPAARIMASCCRLPVVADCGTGGATSEATAELVRACAAGGIAAICLEDARQPKCNSLLPGKHRLAPLREFTHKISVARTATSGTAVVVIARVEALIAGAGLAEALRRGRAYAVAGADAVLIHSKQGTPDEILAFAEAWDYGTPLVVVPTAYPTVTTRDLRGSCTIRMVVYANHGMRAAVKAMQQALIRILEDGSTRNVEQDIATLSEVFKLQSDFQRNRETRDGPAPAFSWDVGCVSSGNSLEPRS